nr:immunoglobulin light chain junction region [Macaca mulatta]MOX80485.1 immunoglobulin light chain junction region [Macaca mulatta]
DYYCAIWHSSAYAFF